MDEKININIVINGNKFPMTIDRDEEEIVRNAAKRVDEKIKAYKGYYNSLDNEAKIITLVSLDMAISCIEEEKKNNTQPYINKIRELSNLIDDGFSKND